MSQTPKSEPVVHAKLVGLLASRIKAAAKDENRSENNMIERLCIEALAERQEASVAG